MIFRLTAPNWECPSPYYGSHIFMSISGIYLLISIYTLYHSLVLSFIQVHEITYFHHTLCLLKYTSAVFSSLAPTDDSRRTLSIYIMFFYRRPYAGYGRRAIVRGLIAGGHLYTSYHGHWSAGSCTQRVRTGTSPTCPTSSAGGTVRTSVCMSNKVQTSNIISTDKYNPVRVTHQIHVKHLKCYTSTGLIQ